LKGIIILGFNENYEAHIVAQYPNNLSEIFNIKASDLMNIYTLHRMNKKEPNFFQMEIKNFTVASFYTGFSLEHYVGQPDYAITAVFSTDEFNNEGLPLDFEGKVRRIAVEILNEKEKPNFNAIVENYYNKLENGELESYWDEYKQPSMRKSEKNSKESIQQIVIEEGREKEEKMGKNFIKSEANEEKTKIESQSNDESMETSYLKLENEVLKEEIESLELIVKEKNEQIKKITTKLTEFSSEKTEIGDWKSKYENLEEQNKKLINDFHKLAQEASKHKETVENQEDDIDEFNKKLATKDTLIDELTKKLENLNKKLEEFKKINEDSVENLMLLEKFKQENKTLKQELEKSNKDNNIHIDSIAKLKLEARELKEKITSTNTNQNSRDETIIDLKKEIKVLRRERDHYKEIIKEKKLL
jgi:uncharacterized coiled-coil protein SlyX